MKEMEQLERGLLEPWERKNICGRDLEYLQEVNGTKLMVSVMNYYLCSLSTSSTSESVTISLWIWPVLYLPFQGKQQEQEPGYFKIT